MCQPIINLQSGFTYKAEALLRWNHPVYGLVDTKEFIALTEERGAITIIGEWVFSEALKAITIYDLNVPLSFRSVSMYRP